MLTDAHIKGWARLTPRQRQCIEALRAGHCTDKAVARAVGLQVHTVMEYLAGARSLLGVHHRIELALIAERMHVRSTFESPTPDAEGFGLYETLPHPRPEAGARPIFVSARS
jgi:DNA-binding CsgD family transcriptional regulator